MKQRILKDIRFYESENQNIEGQCLPNNLGKLFIPTSDTVYIALRIARKLNELKFTCEEFDHIYINLTTFLKENEMAISHRDVDKRIKYIDCGINAEKLSALSENDKNNFIKSMTFTALKLISSDANLELVYQVEKLIEKFDTEIKIHFKTKETNAFKIDIYYQIKTLNDGTKAVINCKDKKTNVCSFTNYKLQHYEDIYTLIDTISLKDNAIILNPKKSITADIINKRYKTPIILKLADFENFNGQ